MLPTRPWNYALQLNPCAPEKSLRLQTSTVPNVPFSCEAPALRLLGQGRWLPDWALVKNAAAAPPQSPVISSEPLPSWRTLLPKP